MALAKEDYQAMEEHVREILSSWLAKQEKYLFVPMGEIEIRERFVRTRYPDSSRSMSVLNRWMPALKP